MDGFEYRIKDFTYTDAMNALSRGTDQIGQTYREKLFYLSCFNRYDIKKDKSLNTVNVVQYI